jgi:putative ABC transport system permease protein
MKLTETFSAAVGAILANRTRSVLTTLGITIGVAAVIAVVSLLQGLSSSISTSFDDLGSNSLTIRSNTSFEEQLQGKRNRLTLEDYRRLARDLGSAGKMTPAFSPFGLFGTTIRAADRSAFTRVSAVSSNYQDTFNTYTATGRFFTQSDERSRRKVAVIGEKLRENLSLPQDPVGEFISIGGEWFKVVGVMETRGELFGLDQDDYVIIPFSTGEQIAGNESEQDISITLNVDGNADMDEVQNRAEQILRKSRKLKADQPDDFKVQTAKQLFDSFAQISNTVTLVAAGMVGISLLVGGIGIMNMMLVSVTERTSEIGICKALGAQRHHILLQFLLEATMLSVLGGLAGIAIGYSIGVLTSFLIPGFPSAVVPIWTLFLATGFCVLIGVVFGVVPAAKAASLSPIEALRRA